MPVQAVLTAAYLAAWAIGTVAAAITWRRRDVEGAAPLSGMLAASALWALCDAIELHAPTVADRRLISQIQYIGVVSAAPFFFQAAWALSRPGVRMGTLLRLGVWAIPALSLLAAWTSAWHQWLWTSISVAADGSGAGIYHYGWWFWVLTAQHYLLVAAGTLLVARAARRVAAPFRAPMAAVVIGVLLPWVGNVAYVFKLGPLPGFNWLSLSIILAGSLFAWVVSRGGLLDLLPRAREALVEGMTDAVLVLGPDGEVLLANPAAHALLPPRAGPFRAPAPILGDRPASERARYEVDLGTSTEPRWVEVRSDPVRDRWGEVRGRLLVARDVTERKRLEAEREKLLADIETALDGIRELQGLLPICMVCRKVRDDAGYWSRLEEFIRVHSAMRFTHGLCPECAVREYGQVGE